MTSASLTPASFSFNHPRRTNFLGVLNLSPVNSKKAILEICKTIFVCLVLSLGALLFSKDANDLALRPIERMIEKVKMIAKNPITATE